MMKLSLAMRIGIMLAAPIVPASLSALLLHENSSGGSSLVVNISAGKAVIFLDARSDIVRSKVALPWAIRLTEESWEDDLPAVLGAWRPDTRIFIFCDGGQCNRAEQVGQRLRREAGLDGIVILSGEAEAISLHDKSRGANANEH